MAAKGMLIVTANPPAFMEEEFNAWYEQEHLPERLAVPGFETGVRYAMMGMERRYIALYDMAGIDVLDTPAYQAVSNERPTPWTKRVVGRCRFERFPTEQVFPGDAVTRSPARLLVVHIKAEAGISDEAITAGADRNFGREGQDIRVFVWNRPDGKDYFVLVGSDGQISDRIETGSFGPGATVRGIGLYAPY